MKNLEWEVENKKLRKIDWKSFHFSEVRLKDQNWNESKIRILNSRSKQLETRNDLKLEINQEWIEINSKN